MSHRADPVRPWSSNWLPLERPVFKKITLACGLLIVAVLVFAATKPDTFHFERTATIAAPPEKVQTLVTDFRNWGAWSPWEKLDPNMTRTFKGELSGVGSVYEWTGNGDVGTGRMEITAVTPSTVTIDLDFIEPMATSNVTQFNLSPNGGGTNVVWSMDGPMPYLSKLLTVFVSMETLLSEDFESGLAQLKAAAEK